MYIKQVYRESSDIWTDILKLIFTILITLLFVALFSLPHTIVLLRQMLIDAGANLSSAESIMSTFPKVQNELETMDVASLARILDLNLNLFLGLLPYFGGLLAIILCNKYINGNSFLSLTTSRQKIDYNRIFYSFTLWASFMVFSILLGYFMMPENYEINFNLKPFLILTLLTVILFPIQTSAEEYFFRGYIMQNIGVISKNRWLPLIITSTAFGLVHAGNPEVAKLGNMIFVYYIGSGLFAGIITLMDEGLELALGWHAANNIVIALFVTADFTAVQTDSILKNIGEMSDTMELSEIFFPVFIVYPAMIYIFSKKYNWKNWKGKLFGKI